MWCIPPQQNAAVVAAMEDVLEVYSRPYDSQYPVVCMDEQPIELHLDARETIHLSETFEPAEARRIWERIELHHTPKHGSWLDIAEIELSAFTKGCLDRRIGTIEELQKESTAWYIDRNRRLKGVDWQFSIGDACGTFYTGGLCPPNLPRCFATGR